MLNVYFFIFYRGGPPRGGGMRGGPMGGGPGMRGRGGPPSRGGGRGGHFPPRYKKILLFKKE